MLGLMLSWNFSASKFNKLMLPKFKEKQSYLPVQARNTPKKPTSVLRQSSWQLYMTKAWQYLQFSAKKYWSIFYVLKNGKKNLKD